MDKDIVMYTRSTGCPHSTLAKRVFRRNSLTYREVFIDRDPEADQRMRDWTGGYRAVPTLLVANPGEDGPCESPAELPAGKSPRGLNRGTMITEPSVAQLTKWLQQNGFID